MWHAVRPSQDEPVEFDEGVRNQMTDQQWQDLMTPGTEIHERWKSQVDVIAWHLRQLRDAQVPVLWRPYHEMNGNWFWWGQKAGENGYRRLYRMLFERLVNFHRLNNLLWVFNANELREGVDPYDKYYPGQDVVDVLATDVYQNGFARRDYDELLALAGAKPIALGETGRMPTVQILRDQPRWTWFMNWGDPGGWRRDQEAVTAIFESEEVLTLEKLPWVKWRQPTSHWPVLR
jgi:mannan endo-1,4-beta-mannosidase